ncbi:MAG: hypothetical protein HN443_05795 [Flavobacteriaceae bacterium]|jgi:hypothetical protein|nr:hypothetical protein [Flavobacteriaceae bacterium]MBT6128146.1 hypothetical protein [Flavobacteriaceae bacterium]
MNFRKLIKLLLILLSLGSFYVVYLMYSNLSFIDTPYLYGGILLLLTGILLPSRK